MCVRSNGVRGDAERSFEFGSSDQRNKGATHAVNSGARWAVRGRASARPRGPAGDAGRFLDRVAVYTLPAPPLAV
jgi:hypothetical protein